MTTFFRTLVILAGVMLVAAPTAAMASVVADTFTQQYGTTTAEHHTLLEGEPLDLERFPTTYKVEVQGGVPELGVYRLVETRPVIEVNFDDETIQFYCEVVLEKSSRELEEFDDDHLRDTRAIILTPYLDHIEAIPFEELAQTIPCPAEINYQQE